MGARFALSPITWAGIGSLLALLQAAAAYVDVKLGIAFATMVIVAAIVTARPGLLLPIAVVTVFSENLTFNGSAVTRILAPAALLLTALELLRNGARLRLGAPLAFACAYAGWAAASGMWTASLEGTRFMLQSLAIALVFMLAFASLVSSERDLRRFLWGIAIASSMTAFLSVIAFPGWIKLEQLELLQAGRSQGLVGDPDFFAAMQLVAVPLVLVLASETQSHRLRMSLYGGLLFILASVFTSLSRGGFLAIVVLGILFVASRPDRLFRSRHEKALALVVVAIGMGFLFSRPFVRGEVLTRAETIYAPKTREDRSGSGRTNIWKAAIKTAEENPLVGIGFGSFMHVSQDLILNTPGVDPLVLQKRGEGENFVAHQTYLGTTAELGLIGLTLYLGLLVSTGVALRRTTNRALAAGAPFVGRVAHALLLGLAAWAVATMFLSGETARMLWIVVGLSLALPKLLHEPTRRSAPQQPRSTAT